MNKLLNILNSLEEIATNLKSLKVTLKNKDCLDQRATPNQLLPDKS